MRYFYWLGVLLLGWIITLVITPFMIMYYPCKAYELMKAEEELIEAVKEQENTSDRPTP